ncbi:uncharacterized protein LOC125218757 isoform X2 [Salvia hispanica]|uniref:uncharacterized protein LOC125218757 isoform X2 n=1 Tax=Salvia hispanica TaxID=49212 RepID=UPI002009562A|nr:uncharacterized protein LOC125218757 isoform X2 [Salvia hispanica]
MRLRTVISGEIQSEDQMLPRKASRRAGAANCVNTTKSSIGLHTYLISRFVYFCVNCNDVKNLEKFSKGSQGRFHFEVGNRKSKNCWSWSVVNKFKRGGEEVHRFREC